MYNMLLVSTDPGFLVLSQKLVLYGLRLVGHSDRQLELALAEQAHVDQVLLVLESEGC